MVAKTIQGANELSRCEAPDAEGEDGRSADFWPSDLHKRELTSTAPDVEASESDDRGQILAGLYVGALGGQREGRSDLERK